MQRKKFFASITIFTIVIILLSIHIEAIADRERNSPFLGEIELTRLPKVGQRSTVIFYLRSEISVKATIQFHFPNGIAPLSQDRFENAYLQNGFNEFRTQIRIDRSGIFPLHASVYAETPIGKNFVDHFFAYLIITKNSAELTAEPPIRLTESPLETDYRFDVFGDGNRDLIVNGLIRYYNDNSSEIAPIQNATVILYRNNEIIDQTQTDQLGEYNFDNLPQFDDEKPNDLQIGVLFSNRVLTIKDRRDRAYELKSEIIRNVPFSRATFDLFFSRTDPNRGIGNIFNAIQKAHNFFLDRVNWERETSIDVIWPGLGGYSYYWTNMFAGKIVGETLTIAGGADQWRNITMYHEYGHAVLMAIYDYDYDLVPRGEYQGTHRLETVSDLGFALSEGWAEFLEAAVDDDAFNVTGRWGEDFPNIETNRWWTGRNDGNGTNKDGSIVEGTVASILWDIFDTENSIDHTEDRDDDTIADRFDLLWEILRHRKPADITEIAIAWRELEFPFLENLEAIYEEHRTLSKPNDPPEFSFLIDENESIADRNFEIRWSASDPDDDKIAFDLYYFDDNLNNRYKKLIEKAISADQDSYLWKTIFLKDGHYRLYAIITDERNGITIVESENVVTIDHTPLEPPKITSTTHPDSQKWCADHSPEIDLETDPEQLYNRKYSFILDHRPDTSPDEFPDLMVRNNQLALSNLNDDLWWLHIRALDSLGYWSEPSHFAIRIDTTPPPIIPKVQFQIDGNRAEIFWTAVTDLSGIENYRIQASSDENFSTILFEDQVSGDETNFSFTIEPTMVYHIRVNTINGSGLESRNWTAIESPIRIDEAPNWDINRDRSIDISDLVLVARDFGKESADAIDQRSDVNRDGVVDIFDLILVALNFAEPISASPIAFVQNLIESPKTETRLLPNFPNPFNPETSMPIELGKSAETKIEIFTIDGEMIREFDLGFSEAGKRHLIRWDGRNDFGVEMTSGIYFVVLFVDGKPIQTRKMILAK